jgi:hypothetical protein
MEVLKMKTSKRIIASTVAALMILTSLLTVNVFAAKEFTDVPADYYYKTAIDSLVTKGIIDGVQEPDGTFTFRPENTITRAEFAKLVSVFVSKGVTLTEKTAQFPDVSNDHWANTYIAYAVKAGIVNGNSDGTFKPENPVTYGEAVKMLVCAKGYGSQYTPTDPWYQGYIDIANKIELTKNAYALGSNEAKRGMVAQLIYNMDYTKNMEMSTPGGVKLPGYDEDEDYETYDGVVMGVFETTLTGQDMGLNKYEIKVGSKVFNIGDYDLDSLYDYLGKKVEVEYEEGKSKLEMKSIDTVGKNDTITLDERQIDRIKDGVIRYYEDEDADDYEEAELSDDLYIIYNGYGVDPDDIDDDFIEEYLDIENGQIKLLNNGGGKDYEVAFVTSYKTYFVTSVTSDGKDKITVHDSYMGDSITFDKDVVTAYKVSSANGSKQSYTISSSSSIAKNTVMSIAMPYDRDDNTQIILSSVKLSGAEVEEMTDYSEPITIGRDEYYVSRYFEERRLDGEPDFEIEVGMVATFYLDFAGNIVYVSQTENSDPYAYVLGFDKKGGFDAEPRINLYAMVGSSAREIDYGFKPTIKFNGKSTDREKVGDKLLDTAYAINEAWLDNGLELEEYEEYSQLIKYKTSSYGGETVISEIYTVDPDDYEEGTITTKAYRKDEDGKKVPYADGETLLKCNSSKAFTDANGSSAFTTNSSTIVFVISADRSDGEKISKKTNTYFSTGKSYLVEPYDVKSNVAKVVLVYTDGSAPIIDILNNEPVCFIEDVRTKREGDEYVEEVHYYTSTSTTLQKKQTEEQGVVSEDLIGQVVRFAFDGSVIVGVQKVFADGTLYDFEDNKPLIAFEADGNTIKHEYNSDVDYYQVIYGTVDAALLDENNAGTLTIVPQVVDDHDDYIAKNQKFYNVTNTLKVYRWLEDDEKFEVVDASYLDSVEETGDASSASKVLVVIIGTIKAIYIVE